MGRLTKGLLADGGPLESIVFWGATGQAKVLRELIGEDGPRLIALFDNDESVRSPWPDVPIYHGRRGFEGWRAQQGVLSRIGILVAIGGHAGRDRLQIQRQLALDGLRPAVAIHQSAFVAASAQVGWGSQILTRAVVGVEATLGEGCIVNTGATVDHECRLGNGVHVCPGANLAGLVVVGDNVMIGTGAVVLPRVQIAEDAVIGAGAVVRHDVPRGACIVGNPGRELARRPV